MRILHALLILALVLGAPLQAASAGMVCASGAPQDADAVQVQVQSAHTSHDHAHAHGEDPHAQHHGAASDDASPVHVCTGACAESCGSACCQCTSPSALALFGVADMYTANALAVSPASSVDGRSVSTEHRPPKSLRS